MTPADAAKRLGIKVGRVRRYLRLGLLRGRQAADGRWTVLAEDLRGFRPQRRGRPIKIANELPGEIR